MAVHGVIQKLFLEVDSNDVTINHHRADEVMQVIKTEVLPQLEEVLESLFEQTGLRLQIDRLDLDLGSCNEQNLTQIIGEELRKQLPSAIKQQLDIAKVQEQNEDRAQASGEANSTQSTSPQGRLVDITLHFLQTGYLPWWSGAKENLASILKSWDEEFASESGAGKIEHLLHIASLQSKVRKRLLLQFKMPFILKALSASQKHQSKVAFLQEAHETFELHKKVKAAKGKHFEIPLLLENKWLESAFEEVLNNATNKKIKPTEWLVNLIRAVVPNHTSIITEIKNVLDSSTASAIPELFAHVEHAIPNVWEALEKPVSESPKRKSEQKDQQQKLHPTKDNFADEVLENVFAPNQRQNDDSIYINNAGLVLLHPFLPHFLKSLGLTENHQFIDEEARLKAIYILHFVATGELTATEDQLYFEKFLCAWPEEEPLPSYAIENKDELDTEVDRLWDAIRSRWKAMKSSQFDALRVNFLHRNGKLEQDHAGHWTLTVEPDGRDILLQTIDWSVYLLRLPWMAEVVYVEWSL